MNGPSLIPIRHTTPNGVRVLGLPLPTLHKIVVNATLHVGSRYETAATNGLSHFLEHMLFRGTPSHPSSQALAHAFENLGGTLVASTSTDTGSLGIAVPPESFHETLQLFAEVFQSPRFSELEIEKGIVREEILESLGDNGTQIEPENLIRELCFGGHPLAMPIIGTAEHLESFQLAQLTEHHQRHYTANNTVVAVAGPVDDAIVAQVGRAFQHVPSGQAFPVFAPSPQAEAQFRFVPDTGSQTSLTVGFRAPALTSTEEPALDLLMRTLDDGMSTRLYGEICDRRGLCYDVSASYEGYADSGIVELHAECTHDNADAVLDAMLTIIRGLRDDGPTPLELEKAKRRHRWEAQQLVDSAEAVADHFALGELSGYDTDLNRRIEVVDAQTLNDLVGVARTWWQPSQLSVVAVGVQPKRSRAKLEALARGF